MNTATLGENFVKMLRAQGFSEEEIAQLIRMRDRVEQALFKCLYGRGYEISLDSTPENPSKPWTSWNWQLPAEKFPTTYNGLMDAGFWRVGLLQIVTEDQLLARRRIGIKTVKAVKRYLSEYDLRLTLPDENLRERVLAVYDASPEYIPISFLQVRWGIDCTPLKERGLDYLEQLNKLSLHRLLTIPGYRKGEQAYSPRDIATIRHDLQTLWPSS